MKRLRHPIRAIREPFGTAGLVVACVALIAALGGTALAAAKLNSTQKKEVEKIAKKFAGKPGAPGAQGPAGPAGKDGSNGAAGEKGATGAQGAAGPKGDTGSAGSAGAAGKSPEIVEEFAVGDPAGCEGNGGKVYEVEGSNQPAPVCNGKEGKDGSPWAVGGTLPPGATETGTWVVSGTGTVSTSLSFPIPLAANVFEGYVHFRNPGDPADSVCPAPGPFVKTNFPKAAPGMLCIIIGTSENAANPKVFGPDTSENFASTAGTTLSWELGAESNPGYAAGTFAVTGCAEESGVPFACPGF